MRYKDRDPKHVAKGPYVCRNSKFAGRHIDYKVTAVIWELNVLILSESKADTMTEVI